VGVYNLPITAVWALGFAANIFIDSFAIGFGDYLDIYAAFATPCSDSLNHKSGLINKAASRSLHAHFFPAGTGGEDRSSSALPLSPFDQLDRRPL
jgi:hypothetical protein